MKLGAMLIKLSKRFAGHKARPETRLSDEQAIEIARNEIGDAIPLWVVDIEKTADGWEIHVGTATVGSGTTVRIDDSTGKVLEVEHWGVR
jgi:hypothetical protein